MDALLCHSACSGGAEDASSDQRSRPASGAIPHDRRVWWISMAIRQCTRSVPSTPISPAPLSTRVVSMTDWIPSLVGPMPVEPSGGVRVCLDERGFARHEHGVDPVPPGAAPAQYGAEVVLGAFARVGQVRRDRVDLGRVHARRVREQFPQRGRRVRRVVGRDQRLPHTEDMCPIPRERPVFRVHHEFHDEPLGLRRQRDREMERIACARDRMGVYEQIRADRLERLLDLGAQMHRSGQVRTGRFGFEPVPGGLFGAVHSVLWGLRRRGASPGRENLVRRRPGTR